MAPEIHAFFEKKEISFAWVEPNSVYVLQKMWEKLPHPLNCTIQATRQRIEVPLNKIDFVSWEDLI